MEFTSRREVRKRGGPHFPAVVIGEHLSNICYGPAGGITPCSSEGTHSTAGCGGAKDGAVFPLSPVLPSPGLPVPLLPICNTPIIDYILENLLQNGVDEVSILLHSDSYDQVKHYLNSTKTSRGKPWTGSKDIKVQLFRSNRSLTNLFEVASEILEGNFIKQDESFLLVPIDAVSVFSNLRELYAQHIRRVDEVPRYAATVLCSSTTQMLRDSLHNVLTTESVRHEEQGMEYSSEPMSPTLRNPLASVPDFRNDFRTVPTHPPHQHHVMIVMNKSTGVVRQLVRFDTRDEEHPAPLLVEFNKKQSVSVRADLVPSGFVFMSSGALSLIKFHIRELHDFYMDILAKEDLEGNVFGVAEVPPEAVIRTINSVEAYLQTNIDVSSRRLFPLTRENCFAEAHAKYSVSPSCPSVFVHLESVRILTKKCGPCVVIGHSVLIPASCQVRGTVLGSCVKVGEGVVLSGSVVMNSVSIGKGCRIINSLIASNVVIADNAEIVNSIIGAECVIGSASPAPRELNSPTSAPEGESGMVIHGQTIVMCEERESDTWLVGVGGRGRAMTHRYTRTAIATKEMFCVDAVPRAADDDEEDESYDAEKDGDDETYTLSVKELVNEALLQPSKIGPCMFEMKNIRLSYGRTNADLSGLVTRLLLDHVSDRHAALPPSKAVKEAMELIRIWNPFFIDLVTGQDEMLAVIRNLCAAIRKPGCPLHKQGPVLLEWFYNSCNDALYEERGYCIISGEALLTFDEQVQAMLEKPKENRPLWFADEISDSDHDSNSSSSDGSSNVDSEDEGVRLIGPGCHKFIEGVRDFLEELDEGQG